jgi:hypothetical protein
MPDDDRRLVLRGIVGFRGGGELGLGERELLAARCGVLARPEDVDRFQKSRSLVVCSEQGARLRGCRRSVNAEGLQRRQEKARV